MNWLDTQTKELLQRTSDDKLAPAKTAEFALVLLRKGPDRHGLVRAIKRINDCGESDAVSLASRRTPVTINHGLTGQEALWGQFELICCDSVSAFLRSEVVQHDDRFYLWPLYKNILDSPEFRPATITILHVPATESAERFMDQFLVGSRRRFPVTLRVPYRKARIMRHWARRVGGQVRLGTSNAQAEPAAGGNAG